MFKQEYFAIAPKRKVRVLLADSEGSPDTALFFIHGLGGRAEQFFRIAPHLQQYGKLILVDLFGHGKTAKPYGKNKYRIERYSEDVLQLFHHYALEKNIVLGHSMGGMLAAQLAAQCGEKVQKLILLSPLPAQAYQDVPLIFHFPIAIINLFRAKIENDFFKATYPETSDPEALALELQASRLNPMHVIKPLALSLRHIETLDVATMQTPTLMIVGDLDQLFPVNELIAFYGQMPNIHIERLPSIGHYAMLEKPYLVESIIDKFIENRLDEELEYDGLLSDLANSVS